MPHCGTGGDGTDADESGGHPRSGETIFPGLALGTELGWATRIGGPAPNPLGADFVKYAVFKNPDWDWRTFDLETAVVQADRIDVIDASADLRAFMRRGGKLLLYHGWADQNFSAQSTIDYYRKAVDTIGSAPQNADSLRLFLAPGMGHCGGGEGLNTFDMVSALERWVENNQPPALVVASQRPTESWVGLARCVPTLKSQGQRDGKSRRSREFSVRDAVTRRLMLL